MLDSCYLLFLKPAAALALAIDVVSVLAGAVARTWCMEHRLSLAPSSLRRWLIALALLAYIAALASLLLPVAPGVALSSGALLALGAAAAWYTLSRIGIADAPRLGGRTQAAWQRQRGLALAVSGVVYLTLVLGVVTTSTGALWRCMSWPLCPVTDSLTLLAVVHRGGAALSTLLVLALVIQTFRVRGERVLRLAAGWALVLMVLQNVLGLVQVALASQNAHFSTEASRLAHLGLGALVWAALAVLATLVVRLPPSKPVEAQPEKAARVETPSLLKDYVSLTKPGVISLLIFTTFAAMYITPLGAPSLWLVVWTLIGGWLMPAGAHALNCYFDRDIDLLMGRTGRRPIPSGRIPPWHALVLGLALGVLAFTILAVFVNMAAALLALAGYFFYVVIYTLMLKRNTFNNIVLGGAAGAFPPLVGWAAVTGNLSLASLFLFAIIFYWTPPHFWALALIRQKDYANAGVPMLPVVAGDAETKKQILLYTIMMIALTVIPATLGMFGVPYLVLALALGGWFLRYVLTLFRADTTAARWGLYRFSLLYLFLLFIAMMVDRLAFA